MMIERLIVIRYLDNLLSMNAQPLFQALADPSRRQILRILEKEPLSVGDLARHFTFSLASLSHHLSILRSADLVRTERRGQQIFYFLNTSITEDLYRLIIELLEITSGETAITSGESR
ncbi:metalloregulator ArsR/SmtB family transcription factor [Acidithiobacillus thiooxidans]|uniref:metalloregulator ArsR/SmtB family transcription factor n=1 Tax=Acidithiobacillus thiooxidans TaxID=930 RepID=UPI0035685683